NKACELVTPGPASGRKSLEGGKFPDNFRLFVPDPPGKGAYPIVTYTWICVLKDYRPVDGGNRVTDENDPRFQRAAKTAKLVRDVLEWCLTTGQDEWREKDGTVKEPIPEQLGYLSLPKEARPRL